MIEDFLQMALEFSKEIWFQLNSQFDLENTEAFKFLKPYLIQLQENPLHMGISIAALFLVPYGLIKVRSISKQREQKLDELMEEMEEEEDEYDEDDPRRLRRAEPELETDEETAKPLFANDETDASIEMDDLDAEGSVITEEDLEAELDEFELEPSETPSDEGFELESQESLSENDESDNLETNAEPVSSLLTESEFDKELNDFMTEELDWKKDELEEKDINTDLSLDDSDQATQEPENEGDLMTVEDNLPADDPFSNYSELDEDEQDKAIKDLQDEMERTINQLTQQIDEPSEVPNAIKDLSQIHIGGDATINEGFDSEEEEYTLEESSEENNDTPVTQTESPSLTEISSDTPISELSDEDILASLDTELRSDRINTTSGEVPDTHDYEPETPGFTFEPESIEDAPELDSRPPSFANESEERNSSPEQTDNLIDRLKFLQTRFENRYQPPMGSPTPPAERKSPGHEAENIEGRYTKASASVPPDNKKYMELLESFIFMKDQKKHK
jgi:hypothetical protein